jgi:hypothetical protein
LNLADFLMRFKMLPPLNEHGLLPEGIHDGTFEEVETCFALFQQSDRRPLLWAKFREFFRLAKASRLVDELLLDGSFVTAKPDPNDIDFVVDVSATHDFAADLSPDEYNLLSKRRVRLRFGFDIVLARAGTDDVTETADFFQQIRGQPHLRKGIVRIRL